MNDLLRASGVVQYRQLMEQRGISVRPKTLFIACCDSWIDPYEVTQTQRGELVIVRNPANIVPPFSSHPSGEAAVIEIAITELHVRNVFVCGHTRCRALASLFAPRKLAGMTAAAAWLEYAQATQRIVCEKYAGEATVAQMEAAAEENVLVQIANLRTHPAVAAAIASEQIQIQGLVHRVETDELAAFDATRGRFVSITANANEHSRASV